MAAGAALLGVWACTAHAEYCDPGELRGAYGFELSGNTDISGASKPVVGVGRLLFGNADVTGYSSINFAGWFLGNPLTGRYQLKADCSLTFSLQDTSGHFQHFHGKVIPGRKRASFRQTDVGGFERGILAETGSHCVAADFQRIYRFRIFGVSVDMNKGKPLAHISANGLVEGTSDGALKFTTGRDLPMTGTYTIEDGCFVAIVCPH